MIVQATRETVSLHVHTMFLKSIVRVATLLTNNDLVGNISNCEHCSRITAQPAGMSGGWFLLGIKGLIHLISFLRNPRPSSSEIPLKTIRKCLRVFDSRWSRWSRWTRVNCCIGDPTNYLHLRLYFEENSLDESPIQVSIALKICRRRIKWPIWSSRRRSMPFQSSTTIVIKVVCELTDMNLFGNVISIVQKH